MSATPTLAELITIGTPALLERYGQVLTAHQRITLDALRQCRSGALGATRMACEGCGHERLRLRSCANRNCPRCQHACANEWLERQRAKRLPVPYFMVTFTLPSALRALAYREPRVLYDLLFKTALSTLQSFARNHPRLRGALGATAVLHTHNRRLDYHPHVHLIVPGGALDRERRQWRRIDGKYLFNARNLASVFRARFLDALQEHAFEVPDDVPRRWVAHCTHVGNGDAALRYLARYLYRGVVRERDILGYDPLTRTVTVRYVEAKTGRATTRTLELLEFLWQLMVHVLPKRLRRVRDYGLLHGNAKAARALLQRVLHLNVAAPPDTATMRPSFICPRCRMTMRVIEDTVPGLSPT
jgi:hypothetical protein